MGSPSEGLATSFGCSPCPAGKKRARGRKSPTTNTRPRPSVAAEKLHDATASRSRPVHGGELRRVRIETTAPEASSASSRRTSPAPAACGIGAAMVAVSSRGGAKAGAAKSATRRLGHARVITGLLSGRAVNQLSMFRQAGLTVSYGGE